MKPVAKLIVATLQAALTACPKPIQEHTLLDTDYSFRDECIRPRLVGLCCHKLKLIHKVPTCVLAKALGTDPDTIHSRIKSAAILRRKQPWNKIYRSLP